MDYREMTGLHDVERVRLLQREYDTPEDQSFRETRNRHAAEQLQESRFYANFESNADQTTRLNQEVLSQLHRLEIRSNNIPIAKGIPIAKVIWTVQWENDQPHVTIPDSADYNYNNLDLNLQPQPNREVVIVGEPVRVDA